jgi:hypothetical protein
MPAIDEIAEAVHSIDARLADLETEEDRYRVRQMLGGCLNHLAENSPAEEWIDVPPQEINQQ